jgi:hypothetical protein
MPNDQFHGGIVVASVILSEDEETFEPNQVTVLLLMPEPPFYAVAVCEFHGEWQVVDLVEHWNIVPAVNGDEFPYSVPGTSRMRGPRKEGYVDLGGDY